MPQISDKILKNIIKAIEANSSLIIDMWNEQFGEIKYYC
jgi:3-methyladenine DNA glycosylase AlkD